MIRFRSKQNGMPVNLSNRFTSVPLIGSRIYQKRRSVIVFEARTKTVSRNEKLIFPIRNLENQQTDGEFRVVSGSMPKKKKKSDLFFQNNCTTFYGVCEATKFEFRFLKKLKELDSRDLSIHSTF